MANDKPQSGTRNREHETPGKPYSQERIPPISAEEEDAMVESSNTDPHSDRLNLIEDHRTKHQPDTRSKHGIPPGQNISKGGIPPGGVRIEEPDEDLDDDPALRSDIMEE